MVEYVISNVTINQNNWLMMHLLLYSWEILGTYTTIIIDSSKINAFTTQLIICSMVIPSYNNTLHNLSGLLASHITQYSYLAIGYVQKDKD